MANSIPASVANDMCELESKADSDERAFIQACRQKDHTMYPLRTTPLMMASPSLIDRAQNRPEVEGHLRLLKKQRLIFQEAYAHQALLYVPDDETLWQATLRRTGKVIQGVAGLVSAVKGLDLNGFMDGLKDIQHGVSGAAGIFKLAQSTIGGVKSLSDSRKRLH